MSEYVSVLALDHDQLFRVYGEHRNAVRTVVDEMLSLSNGRLTEMPFPEEGVPMIWLRCDVDAESPNLVKLSRLGQATTVNRIMSMPGVELVRRECGQLRVAAEDVGFLGQSVELRGRQYVVSCVNHETGEAHLSPVR